MNRTRKTWSTYAMAAFSLWACVARAASGTWNGTADALWTNSANWSASPYPSGGDTASFTNAGNGQATIDLSGLTSVKSLSFDSADAAAYTIGSGGANAQALTVATDGQIGLSSTVAADQTFDADVRLPGNYTFANSAAARTLTFHNVTCTGGSSLSFNGAGAFSFLGDLSRVSYTFNINQNGTGAVSLSGANNQVNMWTFNGANAILNLEAGSLTTFNGGGGNNLFANQSAVINGPGALLLSTGGGENFADNCVASGKTLTINAKLTGATGFEYWHSSNFGTIALLGQNDFTLNVIMNAAGTIAVTNVGNQASTTSNLGAGSKFIFNSTYGGASCLKYLGVGEDSNRTLEFRKSGIVDQSGASGLLRLTSAVNSSGGLTVTLRGSTAGIGEIAGVIPGSTTVAKSGTGTWYLTASNTLSGVLSVDDGSLVVCGTNGSAKSASGVTLNGGALVLLNGAASNVTDRLPDSVPVTLNGGTFCLSNDLTVAAYSETVGALTVSLGSSGVAVTQAPVGGTSSLTFASLTHASSGTVDFSGEGLGDSDRNRIFITGLSDGLIGSWATVNGTRYAAYSSTRGVYAASETVDIAARGYSVITNDATLAVRISYPGESGPIELETSPVSSVGTLIQNSDTPAVVTTTNTLFRVADLTIAADKASLTIGTEPREGTLSTISAGGRLSLENDSAASALTVNASVVSNTAACSLTKNGLGPVVLAGENTYGGETVVNGGDLAFGSGSHAIGRLTIGTASFTLTNAAATHVYAISNSSAYIGYAVADFGRMTVGGSCSWSGYLYPYNVAQDTLVVGHYGRGILTIQDNASVTQKLYVGNYSGSAGAVYQNGGVMHNWGGSSSDPRIGMTGYGYYELNSGTFTNMGYTQLGRDTSGIGILKQSGGAFQMGSVYGGQLGISRGGTGIVYTAGGTFNTSTGINVGDSSDNSTVNGFAEFSVAGDAAVAINGTVNMADRNSMFATLNLNGGVFSANQMVKSASRSGAQAFVNFNGGTLRARAAGFLFGSGSAAPDAVNVFSGGAVIDTADYTCTVDLPLRSPAGNGVSSIGVTPRAGYIGPPMVSISGGGGTGATAVAQFDSASGTVTGIEITSRGFGYTSTPTVRLSGGGTNVQTALGSVTLGANAGGGLTKLGAGRLILNATNTYSGATTVSNGTLFVAMPRGIPVGSALTLDGGNVELGAALDTTAPIRILDGVLRIPPVAQPGLQEGPLSLNFNTWDNLSSNVLVQLTTRMANTNAKPPWTDNITYLYTGYLWNRTGTNATWTFGENIDDNAMLKIDGVTVLNNGTWNAPTIGTVTLTPGAHVFEARFGNGGGGAGLVVSSWWQTNAFGFGVDYLGRNETNIANFVALTDPGDGSLLCVTPVTGDLTNRISVAATVELGAAGVLDLGSNTVSQTLANLYGSGIVSNGALAVTGVIAPGGTNVIGNLTVANSAGLSGTLLVDVAADGSSDRLVVEGDLDLSGIALEIANPGAMVTSKQYKVMTVSGTRSGAFASVSVPSPQWLPRYRADGSVDLVYISGTLISVR